MGDRSAPLVEFRTSLWRRHRSNESEVTLAQWGECPAAIGPPEFDVRAMGLRHNDPMRTDPESRQIWPRKLRNAVVLGVTTVALSITLAACSSSSTPTKSGAPSSKLSGSASIALSGRVVAHYTKHCAVGTDDTPNQVTVAFPGVTKFSGAPLTLVVYAPKNSGSNTYQGSASVASVRLATTSGSNYSWANSGGTVTVSDGGSTGTFALTMSPTPPTSGSPTNQATGTVQVQGNWTDCSSA